MIIAYPIKRENKYLDILYNALKFKGEVVEPPSFSNFFGLSWKVKAFHFHWINFCLDCNLFKSCFLSFCFISYLLILKCLRVNVIWTLHNTETFTHHRKNVFVEKVLVYFLFKVVNNFIVHSQYQLDTLPKAIARRCVYIPHHSYNESAVSSTEPNIAFFGAMTLYKGIDTLLEAIVKVQPKNKKIFLQGSSTNEVKELIASYHKNINKEVLLHIKYGFVEDCDLLELMSKCTVIVIPYKNITNSGTLVHALDFGKHVIIPNCKLTQEFVRLWPELSNIIHSYNSFEEFTALICNNYNQIDSNILDMYKSDVKIEVLVDKYLKIYHCKG